MLIKLSYEIPSSNVRKGTAIFKCAREGNLPLNGEGKFVGIEADLDSDYYLWLTG